MISEYFSLSPDYDFYIYYPLPMRLVVGWAPSMTWAMETFRERGGMGDDPAHALEVA